MTKIRYKPLLLLLLLIFSYFVFKICFDIVTLQQLKYNPTMPTEFKEISSLSEKTIVNKNFLTEAEFDSPTPVVVIRKYFFVLNPPNDLRAFKDCVQDFVSENEFCDEDTNAEVYIELFFFRESQDINSSSDVYLYEDFYEENKRNNIADVTFWYGGEINYTILKRQPLSLFDNFDTLESMRFVDDYLVAYSNMDMNYGEITYDLPYEYEGNKYVDVNSFPQTWLPTDIEQLELETPICAFKNNVFICSDNKILCQMNYDFPNVLSYGYEDVERILMVDEGDFNISHTITDRTVIEKIFDMESDSRQNCEYIYQDIHTRNDINEKSIDKQYLYVVLKDYDIAMYNIGYIYRNEENKWLFHSSINDPTHYLGEYCNEDILISDYLDVNGEVNRKNVTAFCCHMYTVG